jgi:probable F420-dependent oxidoreductase
MRSPAIRVGVSIGRPSDGETWAQTARQVESCGFHSLWVADHLVDGLYSPFTALAWAAAATERLVVGPLVLANDFRHPVIVAREAATLASLSDGRFVLGLGAGHMKSEYDEAGITYDDDRPRVDRFIEAVEVIDALRNGAKIDHAGAHYRVSGHTMYPAGRFPLLVGGNGARVLTAGARHADIVQFTGFSPREGGTRNDLGNLRSSRLDQQVVRALAGREVRVDRVETLVQRMVVTDGARARPSWPVFGVSGDDILIAGASSARRRDRRTAPQREAFSKGRPVAAARRRRPASALAPPRRPRLTARFAQLVSPAALDAAPRHRKRTLRAMGRRFLRRSSRWCATASCSLPTSRERRRR